MKFQVSCNHKAEQYRLDKEVIEVRLDRLDNKYYWSHPKYGCSKSYRTPQNAIIGMLQDHACFGIQIVPL